MSPVQRVAARGVPVRGVPVIAVRCVVALVCALASAGCAAAARHSPSGPPVSIGSAAACSTAVSPQRLLSQVHQVQVGPVAHPFGVAVSADGRDAFTSDANAEIDVVSGLASSPQVAHRIRLPAADPPLGLTMTRDGHYLLAASGSGAVVLDAARAQRGDPRVVLGELTVPGSRRSARFPGGGAIEVTTTPDGQYAFVSLESNRRVAIFDLRAAIGDRLGRSHYVGSVELGLAPVGLTVSPDGRWLYATSELGGPGSLPPLGRGQPNGTLSVIDVGRAVHGLGHAVITSVSAGCSPVRVALSRDGALVWVTARASDELLAFSAAALRSSPRRALRAAVRVGTAPVGVLPVAAGRLIAVADSNRFVRPGARTGITLVTAAAMLAGRPAIRGELPAGAFPREMALTPDGQTLLVTDFGSGRLQVIRLRTLG